MLLIFFFFELSLWTFLLTKIPFLMHKNLTLFYLFIYRRIYLFYLFVCLSAISNIFNILKILNILNTNSFAWFRWKTNYSPSLILSFLFRSLFSFSFPFLFLFLFPFLFPLLISLLISLTPLHYTILLFFVLLRASNATPLPLLFPLTSFLLPSTSFSSSFLDCIQEFKWSGYSDLCHNNSNFGNSTFTLAS